MHVNNDFQKNSNLSSVFETLWRNQELSRVDISRKLELYRSTVSNIINTLLQNNLIFEGERGSVTAKGGRRPVFLTLNEKFGYVVGIELQPDFYTVSAINFAGAEMYKYSGETPSNADIKINPEDNFVFILDSIIKDLVTRTREAEMPLLGLCVAIPGIVDIDNGIIVRSDSFGLENYNFGKTFAKRYGLPIFVENDAKCCAWLQGAVNKNVAQKDFLCVLTRQHNSEAKNRYPQQYTKGIGVGLSIALNGRIVNGHNYAVGEYISRSWTENSEGQTGLPESVLNNLTTSEEAYKEWLIDLFATLTQTIALLEPCEVFLHGIPYDKKDFIRNVIKNDVKQFEAILRKCDSRLTIINEDEYGISKGAAYMIIQKMFEIPSIQGPDSYSRISWDKLFEIQKEGNKQLHNPII